MTDVLPSPDDLPTVTSIKIITKPKEPNKGDLDVYVSNGSSNYTTKTMLTVIPNSGEPACSNNPVVGTYGSGMYSGEATFNSNLVVSSRGYSASVGFYENGILVDTQTCDVSVENPPAT